MIYLVGISLILISGYSLTNLSGLSGKNIFFDLSLGWFLGTGFFTLVYFILVYAFKIDATPIVSVSILLLPVCLFFIQWRKQISHFRESIRSISISFCFSPKIRSIINLILIGYSVSMFILILLHSINTPTNTDDGVRLRAWTPMIIYENNISEETTPYIFQNGILPSFVPLLFWHLNGKIDHFFVNYSIVTNLFFFLSLLYFTPALQGRKQEGIFSVFLVLSIPFFNYHATSTFADTLYIIPFALAFIFFKYYIDNKNNKYLFTSILLFLLTCFSKTEGEIMAITGLAVMLFYFIYNSLKFRAYPPKITLLFFIPFLLYFGMKIYYSGNINVLIQRVELSVSEAIRAQGVINESGFSSDDVLDAFRYSFFSSGNFGIFFYILIANTLYYFRKIFFTPLVWSMFILIAVFCEIFYSSVILFPQWTLNQTTVHRSVMVLAVTGSIFLSTLWADNYN